MEDKLFLFLGTLGISLTFAIHGWEAWKHNPPFLDLLYNFFALLGIQLTESAAQSILSIVGLMDISLTCTIVFLRSHKVFLWMFIWGLVTALSRPLTLGLDTWFEASVRSANFVIPAVLFVLTNAQRKGESKSNKPLTTQQMEVSHER